MQIIGDYQIGSLIGSGTMAQVYRGTDTRTGTPVAIKVPRFSSPDDKQHTLNEVQLTTQLRHPAIVSVLDVIEHSEDLFIVMELVEGKTLRDLLEEQPRLEVDQVLAIAKQVTVALNVAHAQGILHRDIKPDNVMIASEQVVKVMDFGIAEKVDPDRLSLEQRIAGTVMYMSPEQAMGLPLDGRTDLYSLGAMMYEMVTGHVPFQGDNLISLLYRHINEAPLPPRREIPELPVELNRLILRLLKKDPAERYPSANELLSVLEDCQTSWQTTGALADQARQKEEESAWESVERLEATFVDRDEQMAQLHAIFQEVADGKGKYLLIEGEQGVGKSRLVEEFLLSLSTTRVLRGRCADPGISAPYLPFIEALRTYSSADIPEELTQLLETDRSNISTSTQGSSELEAARDRLLDALTQTFLSIAAETPVIIFLEDVQHIDSGSLELMQYLARNAKEVPLLLLMNYTPSETTVQESHSVEQLFQSLESEGILQRMRLQRLDQAAVSLLISSLFELADFSDAFLKHIYRETEGNPLFVLVTLEWLRSEAIIAQDPLGVWSLVHPLEAVEIPQHVSDLLKRRLAGLSPEQRDLLQCASVVEGELFDLSMLAPIVGIQGLELLDMLGSLERVHRLIVPVGESYRFDHVKLKQILYEEIPPERRRQYHLRLAQGLEYRETDTDVYALAYHYEQANRPNKAREYLLRAAASDENLYANDRAVNYYQRALRLIDPGEPDYLDVLQRIVWIQSHLLGEIEDAIAAYHEIMEIARQRNEFQQQAEAIKQLGNLYAIRSEWDASQRSYEESREIFERLGNLHEVGNIWNNIGLNYSETGQLDEALGCFTKASEIADQIENIQLKADTDRCFGMIYAIQQKMPEAIRYYKASIKGYEEVGELRYLAQAQMHLGMIYSRQGDLEQADYYYAGSEESARQTGNIRFLAFVCVNRAELLSHVQPAVAKELCDEALPLLRKADDRSGIIVVYRIYGRIYSALKQWELAERCLNTSIELAQEAQNQLDVADGYRDLGNVLLDSGDKERAYQALMKAATVYQELGIQEQLEQIQEILDQKDSAHVGQ